jgi:hypothetical protein
MPKAPYEDRGRHPVNERAEAEADQPPSSWQRPQPLAMRTQRVRPMRRTAHSIGLQGRFAHGESLWPPRTLPTRPTYSRRPGDFEEGVARSSFKGSRLPPRP